MQVEWWYLVVSTAALGAGCDRFPGQLGSVRAEAEANRRVGTAARYQMGYVRHGSHRRRFYRSASDRLNQRCRRVLANSPFSSARSVEGPMKGAVGLGPERKSASTLPTCPSPNSM